ncbi:MAG: type III-B CRISPR-associated protein Cas10/Cmr2, partial [Marinospirillum sp.]|uniref:type III-B CRISPR-associated protein Cas10/Cmr2 n=1 Tax=Marinospirillum sp. TaxID=2183934 RepID=UPI0019E05E47
MTEAVATTDKQHYFHLTLGPVQGFVAQARRTRDFWAGSFLLSWLSSVAMASVEQQGGEINFPLPDEAFLAALKGQADHQQLPQQGSVPNRFKTLEVLVDASFKPELVVQDMQTAWTLLCEQVWKTDLLPYLTDLQDSAFSLQQTRTIWTRQINHYWEINWCLSDDPAASNLLDRRKNWRSHSLHAEPGIKCMMMEGFQELSGLIYPDQKKLESFWKGLRQRQQVKAGKTDLRETECLSALGFVKRRFVRHFVDFKAELKSGLKIQGWPLPPQVPSVNHLAAAPWYTAVLQKAAVDPSTAIALQDFLAAAEPLVELSETDSRLRCVHQAIQACPSVATKFAGIDGVVFHASQLEQGKAFDDPEQAKRTLSALNHLRKIAELPEPSSFYAVLIMDGDSLGSQMSDKNKQEGISRGLNAFTKGVPERVKQHDGFLVYAGGDDVLALVSLPQAVELALVLRNFYAQCFDEQNKGRAADQKINTSLSGGIQFCHIKTPLTFVLKDAHSLLDDVAKDQTGRDALAIRVWKPGGLHLEWAQPWDYLVEQKRQQSNLLSDAVTVFQEREADSPFTNKFIFKIIEVLRRLPDSFLNNLNPLDDLNPSQKTEQRTLLESLLQAELAHSGLNLGQGKERGQVLQELVP